MHQPPYPREVTNLCHKHLTTSPIHQNGFRETGNINCMRDFMLTYNPNCGTCISYYSIYSRGLTLAWRLLSKRVMALLQSLPDHVLSHSQRHSEGSCHTCSSLLQTQLNSSSQSFHTHGCWGRGST
jgi:hypothetical protein